jgi:hypothetical protein
MGGAWRLRASMTLGAPWSAYQGGGGGEGASVPRLLSWDTSDARAPLASAGRWGWNPGVFPVRWWGAGRGQGRLPARALSVGVGAGGGGCGVPAWAGAAGGERAGEQHASRRGEREVFPGYRGAAVGPAGPKLKRGLQPTAGGGSACGEGVASALHGRPRGWGPWLGRLARRPLLAWRCKRACGGAENPGFTHSAVTRFSLKERGAGRCIWGEVA